MSQERWLLPFQGRGFSASDNDHFLWQHDRLYIMDNHRLALWAWFQHLNPNQQVNLLHIDAHYDCLPGLEEKITDQKLDLFHMDLNQYRIEKEGSNDRLLFRWDNYLPILLGPYRHLLSQATCFTQGIGVKGSFDRELPLEKLYRFLNGLMDTKNPWLINLDLDYFFARDYKKGPMVDRQYIEACAKAIHYAYEEGHVSLLTLALSPECCGGWAQSEEVLEIFTNVFRLNFSLAV